MKCLYCSRRCPKRAKFCCRAHRKLYRNPPPKTVPCRSCGSPQRRPQSQIASSGIVYCKRCKRASGENHYRFKDGSYIDKAGYRMVLIDSKYVKEHRLEWQRANKASLLERGTIHHIRFDLPHNKFYNDPDNLVLVSNTEHGQLHRLYDAARYEECFEILYKAAARQYHYPDELTNWISIVLDSSEDR